MAVAVGYLVEGKDEHRAVRAVVDGAAELVLGGLTWCGIPGESGAAAVPQALAQRAEEEVDIAAPQIADIVAEPQPN